MSSSKHPTQTAQRQLKVVVVVSGHEGFGVETALLNQLPHAEAHGIRLQHVCLERGSLFESLKQNGAQPLLLGGIAWPHRPRAVVLAYATWFLRPRGLRSAVKVLAKVLRAQQADVVYSHSHYGHVLAGLAARRAGCRAVGHFHGTMSSARWFGLARVVVSCLMARLLHGIVANSDFSYVSFWGPARRRARRIYYGIGLAAVHESGSGVAKVPQRLVLVGRLVGWKRQDVAIRATQVLRERDVDCALDIVGGPTDEANAYYRELKALVHELDLEDRVNFVGVLSPPFAHVASAQVCISCSTAEPFGIVVPEAAACGTAMVAANSGGTAETIVDGQTGMHYRANDPQSLADALQRLLADETLRTRLATAAYQQATKKFDSSRQIEKLGKMFRECVGDRTHEGPGGPSCA